jgi:hypothetical protein
MNLSNISEIRITHHEVLVNRLLREGWILLCPPILGLRRMMKDNGTGGHVLVDVPYRELCLGRREKPKET